MNTQMGRQIFLYSRIPTKDIRNGENRKLPLDSYRYVQLRWNVIPVQGAQKQGTEAVILLKETET